MHDFISGVSANLTFQTTFESSVACFFFFKPEALLVVVSAFEFGLTASVVYHRCESCLVHDRSFFAPFCKGVYARVSAITQLFYSFGFSIDLMQSCIMVHVDDVANIRQAAVAHFYRVTT